MKQLLVLLLLSVRLFAIPIIGTFRNPDQSLFNGTLTLTVQVPAAVTIFPSSVVTQGPVIFKITNGKLQSGAQLLSNSDGMPFCAPGPGCSAEINPPNTTYYRAYVIDTGGVTRQMANVVVIGAGYGVPFDIGQAIVTNITTPTLSFQDIIGLRNFSNIGNAIINNLTCTGTVTDCVNGTSGMVRYDDLATKNFPAIDLRWYGTGDGIQQDNCSMISGSHNLSCSDAHGKMFDPATDVGKIIGVTQADSTGEWQDMLISSIQSVTDAHNVVLVDAANETTGAGAYTIYGTDNCAAFCAATQCNATAYTGFYGNGPLTGRTLLAPGSAYVSSCPIYVRNNMHLLGAGEAATQFTLLSHINDVNITLPNWNTDEIQAAIVFGNASAGPHTATKDDGPTGSTSMEHVLASTPGYYGPSIYAPDASGVFILHSWVEGYFGFVCWLCQAVTIDDFTVDVGAPFGIVLAATGNPTNNFGANLNLIDCFNTQTCVWIDGMNEVSITNSSIRYSIDNAFLISSPLGGYTSYRVQVGSGTKFISNPAQAGGLVYHVNGGCHSCSIIGADFSDSPNYDVDIDSLANIPNFRMANNLHEGGANLSSVAAVQTQSGSTGDITMIGDKFVSPGQYALFSILPTKLVANTVTDPFTHFGPLGGGADEFQNGAFYLTGSAAHSVEVKHNSVTSSGGTKYPAVSVNSASDNITIVSEGNTSNYSAGTGCWLCIKNNSNGTSVTWLERSTNAAPSGDGLFIAKFDPVAGVMKLPNMTVTLANIIATGNISATGIITGTTINATSSYQANGTAGISGTVTIGGTCSLVINEGIVTSHSGAGCP